MQFCSKFPQLSTTESAISAGRALQKNCNQYLIICWWQKNIKKNIYCSDSSSDKVQEWGEPY